MNRLIEAILEFFDKRHERELIIRWRLWKSRWFLYRTYDLEEMEKEWTEGKKPKARWNLPRKWPR